MAEQRRFLLRPSGCAAPAPAKATNLVLGPRKVTWTFMRRYRLRQKQQAQKQQEQQQGQARALLAAVAVRNREGEVEGEEAGEGLPPPPDAGAIVKSAQFQNSSG